MGIFGLVAGAFIAGFAVWFLVKEARELAKASPATQPSQPAAGTKNAFEIGAGVLGVTLLGLGITLTPSSPNYQRTIISPAELPIVREKLGHLAGGKATPGQLADITNNIFFKTEADGTSHVIYLKQLPDGNYSLRTVKLDAQGVFTGNKTPESKIPFLYRFGNELKVNPEAEAALELQEEMLQVANTAGGARASKTVALDLAASQGHDVIYSAH